MAFFLPEWLGTIGLALIILLVVSFLTGWRKKLIQKGIWKSGEEDPPLSRDEYLNAGKDCPAKASGTKRIVWVMHSWVPNVRAGSEITAEAQIDYLKKKGWDVVVLVHRWVVPEHNGVRIYPIEKNKILQSPYIVNLIKTADILCVQNYNVQDFIFSCEQFKKPIVVFLHTQNDNRDILNFRFGSPIYVVYNVNFLKLESNNTYPSIVIHPKVDTVPFKIQKKDPRFVTLVNCNENKGGEIIIRLAKALPDVQFLAIKGGYHKQIIDPNPPANLTYMETQQDMTKVYEQTKILIVPSKSETWGRVAVEAMASGTPVITSRSPGLLECVGKSVISCDRNDTSCWVEKINTLMKSEKAYSEASDKALKRVAELDSEDEYLRLEQFLDDCRNRHSSS
jgi:glycosyltransferase involved in cell wall biosynthesis